MKPRHGGRWRGVFVFRRDLDNKLMRHDWMEEPDEDEALIERIMKLAKLKTPEADREIERLRKWLC